MKTFLKVVLLVIAAVVVVKLLPMIFGLGCLLAGAVFGFIALAASVIAALIGSALVVMLVLSPIWVPILAVVGIIALVKRGPRQSRGITA
jgi:hypothetical protein